MSFAISAILFHLVLFYTVRYASCQYNYSFVDVNKRVPGRCGSQEYFDCGEDNVEDMTCIEVKLWRNCRAECGDGSDECEFEFVLLGLLNGQWGTDRDSRTFLPVGHPTVVCVAGCAIGTIPCGACKCVRQEVAAELDCKQWPEQLCQYKTSLWCKNRMECVLEANLMNGQPECSDGSDEDPDYVALLRGTMTTLWPSSSGNTAEQLCQDKASRWCKDRVECVLEANLMNGQAECSDGSDEDPAYVALLRGTSTTTLRPSSSGAGSTDGAEGSASGSGGNNSGSGTEGVDSTGNSVGTTGAAGTQSGTGEGGDGGSGGGSSATGTTGGNSATGSGSNSGGPGSETKTTAGSGAGRATTKENQIFTAGKTTKDPDGSAGTKGTAERSATTRNQPTTTTVVYTTPVMPQAYHDCYDNEVKKWKYTPVKPVCTCPAGQMLGKDGKCQETAVGTVKLRALKLCDQEMYFLNDYQKPTSDNYKEISAIMMTALENMVDNANKAAAFPNVCVPPIPMSPGSLQFNANLACETSEDCTINEVQSLLKNQTGSKVVFSDSLEAAPCAQNPCGVNEVCVVVTGSIIPGCNCKDGFEKRGKVCVASVAAAGFGSGLRGNCTDGKTNFFGTCMYVSIVILIILALILLAAGLLGCCIYCIWCRDRDDEVGPDDYRRRIGSAWSDEYDVRRHGGEDQEYERWKHKMKLRGPTNSTEGLKTYALDERGRAPRPQRNGYGDVKYKESLWWKLPDKKRP